MGLFDRFRGGEKGGDAEVKTSKTQAELKEMMEAKSRIVSFVDKLPEGFDRTIDIPDGVEAPEYSTGKVQVTRKTYPKTSMNPDTGGSMNENVPRVRIMFPTRKYEQDDLGVKSTETAVTYAVDRNGLFGQDNKPIVDVDSQAIKDVTAVLEAVSKEELPE